MKPIIVLSLSFALVINCEIIKVDNVGDLKGALKRVNPGDVIQLSDGYYRDIFDTNRSGIEGASITLSGSRGAVITGPNYGFYLKASYWILQGFSVRDSNKGIVVEGGNNNILNDLDVGNIKQEGIHFRENSSDNIVQNCNIHDTGTASPGFGEGVYIGQAVHNWANGQQDRSDRNQVINNYIGPNVAAECVDIKEGSCCGLVSGNTFDGTGEQGQNYANSWVDVKGDNYVIENNVGTNSIQDGFEIHYISASGVGGCRNRISNNRCNALPSNGKCAVSFSKNCDNIIENNN